ncbi:MAG: 50S ribosomal protein L13 [bacterium]|nr:50S ribosomal protein L13 [bacterium]MDP2705746.1 50S ribosomal protein L13 [bacterium]
MDYQLDAKNKPLGRLASEVALILQGKKHASYEPNKIGPDRVIVKNIKEIVLTGRKADQKIYYRHSGPLGHLKEKKFANVFEKKPAFVLRHAVRLMLPKNRLAAQRLKKLIIE